MNLGEDEAEALFADDRGGDLDDVGDFHLGIDFGQHAHVVLYTEDEQFELTEHEMEQMLDQLDLDSIWQCCANKLKVLRYLRTCGT